MARIRGPVRTTLKPNDVANSANGKHWVLLMTAL